MNVRRDADMPEIAKVKDWHSYPFPFVGGQIDVASFPRLAWSRALREALKPPHLHFSLRDGIDEDDPELLAVWARDRHVEKKVKASALTDTPDMVAAPIAPAAPAPGEPAVATDTVEPLRKVS